MRAMRRRAARFMQRRARRARNVLSFWALRFVAARLPPTSEARRAPLLSSSNPILAADIAAHSICAASQLAAHPQHARTDGARPTYWPERARRGLARARRPPRCGQHAFSQAHGGRQGACVTCGGGKGGAPQRLLLPRAIVVCAAPAPRVCERAAAQTTRNQPPSKSAARRGARGRREKKMARQHPHTSPSPKIRGRRDAQKKKTNAPTPTPTPPHPPPPPPPTHTNQAALKVGDNLSESSEYYRVLRVSDGTTVSLASLKGKPLVLFFCESCVSGRGEQEEEEEEERKARASFGGGETRDQPATTNTTATTTKTNNRPEGHDARLHQGGVLVPRLLQPLLRRRRRRVRHQQRRARGQQALGDREPAALPAADRPLVGARWRCCCCFFLRLHRRRRRRRALAF